MGLRLLLLAYLTLTLSSCATSPIRFEDSTPVSTELLSPDFAKYATSTPDSGKVIVIRDSGFTGSAGKAELYLNGIQMARFEVRASLVLYAPKGNHTFVVTRQSGSPIGQPRRQTVQLGVEQGKEYYLRISVSVAGLALEQLPAQ